MQASMSLSGHNLPWIGTGPTTTGTGADDRSGTGSPTVGERSMNQSTTYLGPNIANFDQLKVGDQVEATYTKAVVRAIAKGSSSDIRSNVEADAARAAPQGGKPGLSATERTTVVANVVSVDPQQGRVTLKGIGSTPVDFRVRDKRALEKIKPQRPGRDQLEHLQGAGSASDA